MHLRLLMLVVAAMVPAACHCESAATLDTDVDDTNGQDSEVVTSTWGASGVLSGGSSGASDETTGTPFDPSRWIGRYHYENPFLPFGERGDPGGTYMLMNFEVFEDSTAVLFYDECFFEEGRLITYTWAPSTDGWLSLRPSTGDSSLRFASIVNLETLRVHLIEPCRGLEFEADGTVIPWTPFLPGESCWIDRCTTGSIMQADYCEGEEPPPCP